MKAFTEPPPAEFAFIEHVRDGCRLADFSTDLQRIEMLQAEGLPPVRGVRMWPVKPDRARATLG